MEMETETRRKHNRSSSAHSRTIWKRKKRAKTERNRETYMSSSSSDIGSREILRQISESLSERRRFQNRLSGKQFPHRRTTVRWNCCPLLHQTPQSSGSHWCRLQDRSFLGEFGRNRALREMEIAERKMKLEGGRSWEWW